MIRSPLLVWMLRRIGWVTLAAGIVALIFTLSSRDVLDWRMPLPFVFILVHCAVLTVFLGRCGSGAFGFLYTRGYSRDSLWGHAMLAMSVSMLVAWAPAAALIWSGARAHLQDYWQNPSFPVMTPREAIMPWAWLGEYVLFLAVFQLSWIRWSQPYPGSLLGMVVAIGTVIAAGSCLDWIIHGNTLAVQIIGAVAAVWMVTALLAGWRMHRTVEVRV